MRFGAHAWDVNERITGTARLASEVQAADTFGLASLELRELGLRVRIMPQYRARPDMANWQNAPWFHVGSLSAGYGMYLVGDQESLDSMYASIRDDLFDWDKRMAWWQRVTDEGDGLPHKREEYRAAIAAFMAGTGQSQANVDTWRRSFDGLISWT
jgi:hypothetical protein